MIEPALVAENSFGGIDGAQFERRLFSGVLFREYCFPHQTAGLISYYSMFATTEYLLVMGNSDCHQFSLEANYPYKDTRLPKKLYTVFKFIVIISCFFLLFQKVYTLLITSLTLYFYP